MFTETRKACFGILRIMPIWAKKFPIGTEVSFGGAESPMWGVVTKYAKDPQVRGGSIYGKPFFITRKGCFVSVRLYGGEELLIPLSRLHLWEARKNQGGMFGKLLCALNIHAWEKQVSRRTMLRYGFGFLLYSVASQNGLQCCERPGCTAHRKVFRRGVVGIEKGADLKWEPAR